MQQRDGVGHDQAVRTACLGGAVIAGSTPAADALSNSRDGAAPQWCPLDDEPGDDGSNAPRIASFRGLAGGQLRVRDGW
jgi:hypothetical protein